MTAFSPIEEIIVEIRHGRMVIIVDDEDRENEGDLVCASAKITPELINFMAPTAADSSAPPSRRRPPSDSACLSWYDGIPNRT